MWRKNLITRRNTLLTALMLRIVHTEQSRKREKDCPFLQPIFDSTDTLVLGFGWLCLAKKGPFVMNHFRTQTWIPNIVLNLSSIELTSICITSHAFSGVLLDITQIQKSISILNPSRRAPIITCELLSFWIRLHLVGRTLKALISPNEWKCENESFTYSLLSFNVLLWCERAPTLISLLVFNLTIFGQDGWTILQAIHKALRLQVFFSFFWRRRRW